MWFFSDPLAQERLITAAAEWDETPYRPFSRAKGPAGGVDCVGFAEEIFVACGAVEKFSFPRTDADYQSSRAELRVLRYLRGQVADDPQSAYLASRFVELELPEGRINLHPALFMPGDLLVLRDGGQMHLPIMLRGRRFVHCMNPLGVQLGNIHDTTFSGHFDALFRARSL